MPALPREELYQRIESRVDAMLAAGLVEEVRRLLIQPGIADSRPMQSLGYRQVLACLNGSCSLQEARDNMVRETRRYAKRQITWFKKRPPGLQTVAPPPPDHQTLAMVATFLEAP